MSLLQTICISSTRAFLLFMPPSDAITWGKSMGIVAVQHGDDCGFSLSAANLGQTADGLLADPDVSVPQARQQFRNRFRHADVSQDGGQVANHVPTLILHHLQYDGHRSATQARPAKS